MSNKDNLLNAGKKRALPPRPRNIPEATDLPLSEEEPKKIPVVEATVNKPKDKDDTSKSTSKTTVKQTKTVEPKAEPVQVKRGPGKPKKRKEGDKKISFWLDEDLVPGLFGNLGYGDSASDLINEAVREYQKKHKIL